MNSLRQRAWTRLYLTFPERQIYIRSDGRVQFLTLSSHMQAIFAGISLLFLAWVAFTSVNVIFRDGILASKESHFEQMQASYESRIADLQLSYDELNGALVVAQDRFKAIADSFEAKQQALAAVIEHKKSMLASLGIGAPDSKKQALDAQPPVPASPGLRPGVGGAFDTLAPESTAALAPPSVAGTGPIADRPASYPLPPASHSTGQGNVIRADRPGFFKGAVGRLGALFHRKISTSGFEHPIIKEATAQSARIMHLDMGESALLGEAVQDVDKETARLTRALRVTGLDSKAVIKRLSGEAGQGGPLIPIELADMDEGFAVNGSEASATIDKFDRIVATLNALPLAEPTEIGGVSSGFGARVDPFNEELAFHSGVDFSGPTGAEVHATAAGIVVFSGPRGAYGNTVEVDHGYGIRTRYAHLSKIVAQAGTRLEKGAIVGKLGSTGRSTGPHVHYEVWYDNAVRDPSKFIKAGNYVLEE